jgi:hypothetical protein
MSAFIGIGTILVSARRVRALPIVGAMALFLGACAHNVADTPALQWQVNTAEASESSGPALGATAPSSVNCGHDAPDGCYVYRGGRDPKTGLALTQL